MSDILTKNDGKPFANERVAKSQQTLLEKEGIITKVVPYEDGFALEKVKTRRPKRVPLAKRNVLTAPPQEGYVKRFVNDIDDRIKRFEDAGWEVVRGDVQVGDERAGAASQMGSAVSVPAGNNVNAVLMRKRKDWFEEDEREKQAKITESERNLKLQTKAAGRYGDIQISSG